MEFPLTFATAGLVGLGGLALVMGTALSSLAELLTLLPGRGGWAGADPRSQGHQVLRGGTRRPHGGTLMAAAVAGEGATDAVTHRAGVEAGS